MQEYDAVRKSLEMKEEELRQLEEKLNARENVYLCDEYIYIYIFPFF